MTIPLLEFELFNTLPQKELDKIAPKVITKTYAPETFVFNQGQESLDFLFLIVSGLAQTIVHTETGSTNTVGFRHPGQFFGETVLLDGTRYPASVKAAKELTCYLLDKETFNHLLKTQSGFAGFFSHILAGRLRELYHDLVLEQPVDVFGLSGEPFKKRLSEIMSYPVVTCSPDMPVNEIARIFTQLKISSVVVIDNKGKLMGLVTERDLIGKVLALDSNPKVVHAIDVMDKNPAVLPHDAFFYQALLTMIKQQGKYILVMEQGRPVGVVTIGDLSKARTTSSLSIVRAIEASNNTTELAPAMQQQKKVVATLSTEKATAGEICGVVSELNDALMKRLLVLAEDTLYEAGFGQPPADYCWLVLGSGGRREHTLASDQDNAIVYGDTNHEAKNLHSYFQALSKLVVTGLEECGIPRCPGGITADNPPWCQPLSAWKTTVNQWSRSKTVWRQFNSLLDMRPVYGQEHLAQELREYIQHIIRLDPAILNNMAEQELSSRVSSQMFALDSKTGAVQEIDLKQAGCAHIINCIRLFALKDGLAETNTISRLNKLVQLHALSSDDAEYFEAAWQTLMLFWIRQSLHTENKSHTVAPYKLSPRQRSVLRESMLAVERLQNLTAASFSLSS